MKSLKTKISLIVIGLIAAVMGLSAGYSYWNEYRSTQEEITDRAQSMAKLLSGLSEYALLSLDYSLLDPILLKALDQEGVLYIRVVDKEGRVLRDQKREKQSDRSIEVQEPVRTGQEVAGNVIVGLSTEKSYRRLIKNISIALIQILIGLTVASSLLIFLLNRVVVRRINYLSGVAREIAAGTLTTESALTGEDEIVSLSVSINTIAKSLREMIVRIKGITGTIAEVTSEVDRASRTVLSGSGVQKTAVQEATVALGTMSDSTAKVSSAADKLSVSSDETSSSVAQMTSSIGTIASSAGEFDETAHETASSIEEMFVSIRQISESLNNLLKSSESVSSSVAEVDTTVKDIEKSASQSVELAEKVSLSASQKGMRAAQAAMEGIENIRKSVTELAGIINTLGRKSQDINSIVTVIDEVADQTHLLALNAAIIAAKAREHGAGFAVVADEVKNLARKTSKSTQEIAALITSVQDMVKSSVERSSEGLRTVDVGFGLVRDLQKALREIVESSTVSTDMAKAIQRSTTEESLAIQQITGAIREMTSQTENISQALLEQSKGGKLILEATERIKDLSTHVRSATSQQMVGSHQIAGSSENVAKQAAEIAQSAGQQKQMSQELIRCMEKISDITDNLMLSVQKMTGTITSQKEEASNLSSELQRFVM